MPDEPGVFRPNAQLLPVFGEDVVRRPDDLIWVDVPRQLPHLLPPVLLNSRLQSVHQVGGRLDPVFPQAAHKGCLDDGAVFVLDPAARQHVVQFSPANAEKGQPRRKQEKVDLPLPVKGADGAQDGKGRVVNDHAPGGVFVFFIVSTGKEGPHDLPSLQAVPLHRPGFHRLVHVGRGIAVVGGQLVLEFFGKILVFLVALALRFPEVPLPVLVRLPGVIRCSLRLLSVQKQIAQPFLLKAQGVCPKVQRVQPFQFDFQHGAVPFAKLRHAVVGENVGLALRLAQPLGQHAGHLGHPFRPGRHHPPVSGQDVPCFIDQHRRHKPEFPQGASQLGDLVRTVDLCVVGIGHQFVNISHRHLSGGDFNFLFFHLRLLAKSPWGKNPTTRPGRGRFRNRSNFFGEGAARKGTPRARLAPRARAHPRAQASRALCPNPAQKTASFSASFRLFQRCFLVMMVLTQALVVVRVDKPLPVSPVRNHMVHHRCPCSARRR